MSEVLFYIEMEGIIDSLSEWVELREIRSELDHDDSEDLEEALRDLKKCILKMGGDIDIAVDSNLSDEEFKMKKIKVLTTLLFNDFDFKIDIVKYHGKDSLLTEEIDRTGIRL